MTWHPTDPDRRHEDRVTPTVSRVLVVDDSRAVRRILRRTLEDLTHAVLEAADGEEALAVCRAEGPDLVLLDVDMPVMDGMTALRHLKADPELSHLPVIFLTARTTGDDVAEGLEAGAQDYLRKPCHPAELTARVGNALRLKAAEDALLEHARLLDEMSTTDLLTGVGNRRRHELILEELVAARGPEAPTAVIMADIDHFKRVNDEHGHPIGDLVLKIAARRLAHLVEAPGSIVRWGGEEFLVVHPELTDAGLADLAEQLRAAVGGSTFGLGDGQTLDVTISVGAAVGTLADVHLAVKRADEALYEAKQAGRNRVVVHRD